MKKSNYNIIFLQETHSTHLSESLWKKEWNDQCFFSHGTSSRTGVCILFNNLPGVRVEKQFHDDCGRVVVCQINIGDNLTLCNVYGPNNDNPNFFEKCMETLKEFSVFNTVLNT